MEKNKEIVMKKIVKFIVSVKIGTDNKECLKQVIKDILEEQILLSAVGCGQNGFYSYEAIKTQLKDK